MKALIQSTLIALALSSFTSVAALADAPIGEYIQNLEGEYVGFDQLGRECEVSITSNNSGNLNFVVTSIELDVTMELGGVSPYSLGVKAIGDTKFARENQSHFDPSRALVNYYITRYFSPASDHMKSQTTLGIEWRSPEPSVIMLEHAEGDIIYTYERESVRCGSLQRL